MIRHPSGMTELSEGESETRHQKRKRQCRNLLIFRRRAATRFARVFDRMQEKGWRESGRSKEWYR